MKRLIRENKNTAQEYNRIFKERQAKGVDSFDMKRWKILLKYWNKNNSLYAKRNKRNIKN